MKKVNLKVMSILLAGGLLVLTSCGDNNSTNTDNQSDGKEQVNSSAEQGAMKNDKLSSILSSYFEMSDNLTNDSAKDAAKSSEKLRIALENFNGADLSEEKSKEVDEIVIVQWQIMTKVQFGYQIKIKLKTHTWDKACQSAVK